jgi:hypothetical protein
MTAVHLHSGIGRIMRRRVLVPSMLVVLFRRIFLLHPRHVVMVVRCAAVWRVLFLLQLFEDVLRLPGIGRGETKRDGCSGSRQATQ